MRASVQKIMVVAGGSGGHIFPAVGFSQEISQARPDTKIIFITTAGKKSAELIPVEFNPVFLKTQRTPYGLLKLFWRAGLLVSKKNPDVVFCFGGYFSVPFVLAAKLLGKKTLLHEQNVVPGRANRFLSFFVDKIAVSFPRASEGFRRYKKKIFLCRYPLRKTLKRIAREEALRFFGFDPQFFIILIVGGSQGAHRINEEFVEALKINKNLSRVQVIHITGPADFAFVSGAYQAMSAKSKVFAFLPEMNYAYSVSGLVVSRAGAGAVSEISYFGLPSILIPYPHAAGHQKENAKVLAERGASILLEDEKLTPSMINGLLDIFIDDTIRRKAMSGLAESVYQESKNCPLSDLI